MSIITRKVISCGILLFRNPLNTTPEFLLMKHQNRFDLPKGHKEIGETDLKNSITRI